MRPKFRKEVSKRSDSTNILYSTIYFNSYEDERTIRYETLINVWQKSHSRNEVLNTFKNLLSDYDDWEDNLILHGKYDQPGECNSMLSTRALWTELSDGYFDDTEHKAVFYYSINKSIIMNDVRYLRKRGIKLQTLNVDEKKQVDWSKLKLIACESAA